MVGVLPQSNENLLIDRINELARQKSVTGIVDDWAWRSLKRDVEKQARLPDFAASATLLLATIWGIAGNIEEMDRCFNQYAGKYGKDWPWYRDRASQGPSNGRFDRVIEMLNFGYPHGERASTDVVARLCYQAGLFFSAEEALLRSVELAGGRLPAEEMRPFIPLVSTVAYMREHGVDELDVSARLEVASRVVIKMTGPLTNFSITSNEWGIIFEYEVNQPIERLIEIDFAITRELVSLFDDTLSQHISIGVTPFPLREEHVN